MVGKKARIIKGFSDNGYWKNGSVVTVKEVLGDIVKVEEFLGELHISEIELI